MPIVASLCLFILRIAIRATGRVQLALIDLHDLATWWMQQHNDHQRRVLASNDSNTSQPLPCNSATASIQQNEETYSGIRRSRSSTDDDRADEMYEENEEPYSRIRRSRSSTDDDRADEMYEESVVEFFPRSVSKHVDLVESETTTASSEQLDASLDKENIEESGSGDLSAKRSFDDSYPVEVMDDVLSEPLNLSTSKDIAEDGSDIVGDKSVLSVTSGSDIAVMESVVEKENVSESGINSPGIDKNTSDDPFPAQLKNALQCSWTKSKSTDEKKQIQKFSSENIQITAKLTSFSSNNTTRTVSIEEDGFVGEPCTTSNLNKNITISGTSSSDEELKCKEHAPENYSSIDSDNSVPALLTSSESLPSESASDEDERDNISNKKTTVSDNKLNPICSNNFSENHSASISHQTFGLEKVEQNQKPEAQLGESLCKKDNIKHKVISTSPAITKDSTTTVAENKNILSVRELSSNFVPIESSTSEEEVEFKHPLDRKLTPGPHFVVIDSPAESDNSGSPSLTSSQSLPSEASTSEEEVKPLKDVAEREPTPYPRLPANDSSVESDSSGVSSSKSLPMKSSTSEEESELKGILKRKKTIDDSNANLRNTNIVPLVPMEPSMVFANKDNELDCNEQMPDSNLETNIDKPDIKNLTTSPQKNSDGTQLECIEGDSSQFPNPQVITNVSESNAVVSDTKVDCIKRDLTPTHYSVVDDIKVECIGDILQFDTSLENLKPDAICPEPSTTENVEVEDDKSSIRSPLHTSSQALTNNPLETFQQNMEESDQGHLESVSTAMFESVTEYMNAQSQDPEIVEETFEPLETFERNMEESESGHLESVSTAMFESVTEYMNAQSQDHEIVVSEDDVELDLKPTQANHSSGNAESERGFLNINANLPPFRELSQHINTTIRPDDVSSVPRVAALELLESMASDKRSERMLRLNLIMDYVRETEGSPRPLNLTKKPNRNSTEDTASSHPQNSNSTEDIASSHPQKSNSTEDIASSHLQNSNSTEETASNHPLNSNSTEDVVSSHPQNSNSTEDIASSVPISELTATTLESERGLALKLLPLPRFCYPNDGDDISFNSEKDTEVLQQKDNSVIHEPEIIEIANDSYVKDKRSSIIIDLVEPQQEDIFTDVPSVQPPLKESLVTTNLNDSIEENNNSCDIATRKEISSSVTIEEIVESDQNCAAKADPPFVIYVIIREVEQFTNDSESVDLDSVPPAISNTSQPIGIEDNTYASSETPDNISSSPIALVCENIVPGDVNLREVSENYPEHAAVIVTPELVMEKTAEESFEVAPILESVCLQEVNLEESSKTERSNLSVDLTTEIPRLEECGKHSESCVINNEILSDSDKPEGDNSKSLETPVVSIQATCDFIVNPKTSEKGNFPEDVKSSNVSLMNCEFSDVDIGTKDENNAGFDVVALEYSSKDDDKQAETSVLDVKTDDTVAENKEFQNENCAEPSGRCEVSDHSDNSKTDTGEDSDEFSYSAFCTMCIDPTCVESSCLKYSSYSNHKVPSTNTEDDSYEKKSDEMNISSQSKFDSMEVLNKPETSTSIFDDLSNDEDSLQDSFQVVDNQGNSTMFDFDYRSLSSTENTQFDSVTEPVEFGELSSMVKDEIIIKTNSVQDPNERNIIIETAPFDLEKSEFVSILESDEQDSFLSINCSMATEVEYTPRNCVEEDSCEKEENSSDNEFSGILCEDDCESSIIHQVSFTEVCATSDNIEKSKLTNTNFMTEELIENENLQSHPSLDCNKLDVQGLEISRIDDKDDLRHNLSYSSEKLPQNKSTETFQDSFDQCVALHFDTVLEHKSNELESPKFENFTSNNNEQAPTESNKIECEMSVEESASKDSENFKTVTHTVLCNSEEVEVEDIQEHKLFDTRYTPEVTNNEEITTPTKIPESTTYSIARNVPKAIRNNAENVADIKDVNILTPNEASAITVANLFPKIEPIVSRAKEENTTLVEQTTVPMPGLLLHLGIDGIESPIISDNSFPLAVENQSSENVLDESIGDEKSILFEDDCMTLSQSCSYESSIYKRVDELKFSEAGALETDKNPSDKECQKDEEIGTCSVVNAESVAENKDKESAVHEEMSSFQNTSTISLDNITQSDEFSDDSKQLVETETTYQNAVQEEYPTKDNVPINLTGSTGSLDLEANDLPISCESTSLVFESAKESTEEESHSDERTQGNNTVISAVEKEKVSSPISPSELKDADSPKPSEEENLQQEYSIQTPDISSPGSDSSKPSDEASFQPEGASQIPDISSPDADSSKLSDEANLQSKGAISQTPEVSIPDTDSSKLSDEEKSQPGGEISQTPEISHAENEVSGVSDEKNAKATADNVEKKPWKQQRKSKKKKRKH